MNKRKTILTIVFSFIGALLLIIILTFIFSNTNNIEGSDNKKSENLNEEKIVSDYQDTIADNGLTSDVEVPVDNTISPSEKPEKLEEDIRMFLFLGIDRTEERDSQYSIYRADSISVLRVDVANAWAKVLSIPRDTYTYLPIREKNDKINHAYAFGTLKGRAEVSMVEAVNLLLEEEEMRKYFTLEMEPIATIVDQIGGVWIDVEVDMHSHGADLSKGYQKLDGEEAFDYVHWRYSGDGDIGRIRRQQQFAVALLKKLSEEYSDTDLTKFFINNSEYTNTNIHVNELAEVTLALSKIEDIEFKTLQGSSIKIDGIYYWKLDEDELEEALTWFYDNK